MHARRIRKVSRYRVRYELEESGAWMASVPSVPGCHTYGQTLDQTRARVREALCLFVDDADAADLVDSVRLPAQVRRAAERALRARRSAEAQQASARAETAQAVRLLTRTLRLGTRDGSSACPISAYSSSCRVARLRRRRRPPEAGRAAEASATGPVPDPR